jgi:hypothetical protein
VPGEGPGALLMRALLPTRAHGHGLLGVDVPKVDGSVIVCVCLLLQDLVQSCLHGGGGDMGGHVLR